MICINCCKPVESLYTIYSNNHLKLTDCLNCEEVVDKYVEYDDLLLFLNLLLLKPGAYRHMVFNSFENRLDNFENIEHERKLNNTYMLSRSRSWFLRVKNDKVKRIWVIMVAFEVYLTWASEEKLFKTRKIHSKLINNIFQKDAVHQYLYFSLYCLIDIFLLIKLSQIMFKNLIKFPTKHPQKIISYTILLSYGAKVFPILMLVWPYDSLISPTIIKCVANLYIIEALRIITDRSYPRVLLIFSLLAILRYIMVNSILSFIVLGKHWNGLQNSFYQFFTNF
ncbi:sterol homeostasis protein ARV1 SCDLUD_001870 [Saccharomycodes ludwigii]|uniref:sterol homeostasis protein ARV1 n=1 Tax=Saccharomycodes ludwigii TaxID=36035 RepID=UPI001E87C5F8|nr:hypothetical protein SCDLUD_001870 [Saccharomycodes ludwigii]KAH3902059.1 hypothetical protein SCDLUD_001870 [Saccharomycodes ludwigii]